MGARAVLIKGGHREGDALDLLFDGDGMDRVPCPAHRHPPHPRHRLHLLGGDYGGPGRAACALRDAVARAKRFIDAAIRTNPGLGHGCGPVNHFAEVE